MMINLKNSSTYEIIEKFKRLEIEDGYSFEVEVLESDIQRLGYKTFVDLAQLFFMKIELFTSTKTTVIIKFYKLNSKQSFHKETDNKEKYGVESEFFTIDKTTEVSFLYYYQQALEFIDIRSKDKVLNLGINRGDEFKVIKNMLVCEEFKQKNFTGVDYSQSAINFAIQDFSDKNINFTCHDINMLHELSLEKFDLIISIGTLQSSNINFNVTFMSIYQNLLKKDGAIILGFPNCRWIDKEMIYGAKAPNYAFSEMSLVLKDIHFCKKYLQQKGYRVVITGKEYLFLTARKIIKKL